MVLSKKMSYFVREHIDCANKYSEGDIVTMLDYLIDNILVEFGGRVFEQTVGIAMGTNYATCFCTVRSGKMRNGKKEVTRSFHFTFLYIDDVLSFNNLMFSEHLDQIYPTELEIKETTNSKEFASYLDLFLETDQENKIVSKIYDKRDDLIFPIVNFQYVFGNIPASPSYGFMFRS